MYSRNPARFGPNPKSYFNIELYKSEGQTLLDFWTVGYHTFPTREKKEKRTERDTLKKELLIFWSCWIFQGCFMIVYILLIRKFTKNLLNCSEWIFVIEEICDLTFECFFFDIEGKLWKSRGLWRLAEKGLQYSAQCPLILANSNSIAVVYKTQW